MPIRYDYHINFDMVKRRYNIPSSGSLIAFESAARHLNFTRAADELNTSQSAVSRYVSELEDRIGHKLFLRGKRELALTQNGQRLYAAVSNGLDRINSELEYLKGKSAPKMLTITCSHEVSHLYLMPRYQELQTAIGEDVNLNVLTQEYNLVDLLDSALYDVALTYRKPDTQAPSVPSNVVLAERVRPLCSPNVLEAHRTAFSRSPDEWPKIPLLDINKPNEGWTSWREWLEFQNVEPDRFEYRFMTNYVYLLEAAAAGQGIILGWQGLVDRYVENGSLVAVSDSYFETEHALCVNLTRNGRNNPAARRCLEFLTNKNSEDLY
ncbi:MAG: LysR family transcriptional regulator [Pseudomonadota bacterium]